MDYLAHPLWLLLERLAALPGTCNTPHAIHSDMEATSLGSLRSFCKISPPSFSLSASTSHKSHPISTSNGALLKHQGLWIEKGRRMPSHNSSYIPSSQNGTPGETTKLKSHALLNNYRHLGVINRGIRTT
jgi:hypothetical protein